MLSRLYAKWMYAWETALTTRDTNRIVRPLEWGFDWLEDFSGCPIACPEPAEGSGSSDVGSSTSLKPTEGSGPSDMGSSPPQISKATQDDYNRMTAINRDI